MILQIPMSISTGTPDHPCDMNSRWRKISFVENDYNSNYVLNVIGTGPFKFIYDESIRTVVDDLTISQSNYANYTFDPDFDYVLCGTPLRTIGSNLRILLEDGKCVTVKNPAVNLDGYENDVSAIFNIPDGTLESIDNWRYGEGINFKLNISMFDTPSFASLCSNLPSVRENGDEAVFGKLSDGTWLIFDPRINFKRQIQ